MKKFIEYIKKEIWPIIAAIITLSGFSLYNFIFEKNTVSLEYQITNHISALDVRENLSNLDIVYNGRSLTETKENIEIFTIRLINTGNTIIKENDYANINFGLKIINGVLIEKPRLISTSNNYLKENATFNLNKQNEIYIPKLIIEPNEKIEFKIYMLANQDKKIEIISLGKIAGIKQNIKILTRFPENNKTDLSILFSGGMVVHLIRIIVYTALFITLVLLYAILIDQKRKVRRYINVLKYKKNHNFKISDEGYLKHYIKSRDITISFPIAPLNHKIEVLNHFYKSSNDKNISEVLQKKEVEKLIDYGIIFKKNGELFIDEEKRKRYLDFVFFILKWPEDTKPKND